MQTLYVTADTLKNTLSLQGTTFADPDIDAAIAAASRAVDDLCSRHFYQDDDTAQIRYYSPDDLAEQDIDDLVTLASLQTDSDGDGTFDQTWVLDSDFVLDPINAQADPGDLRSYTKLCVHPLGQFVFPVGYPRSVKLVGKFGWPEVPDSIVQATGLIAARLLNQNRSAPFGIVVFDGGAIRLAGADSTVRMLIGPYMHHRRVATA